MYKIIKQYVLRFISSKVASHRNLNNTFLSRKLYFDAYLYSHGWSKKSINYFGIFLAGALITTSVCFLFWYFHKGQFDTIIIEHINVPFSEEAAPRSDTSIKEVLPRSDTSIKEVLPRSSTSIKEVLQPDTLVGPRFSGKAVVVTDPYPTVESILTRPRPHDPQLQIDQLRTLQRTELHQDNGVEPPSTPPV